MHIRFELAVAAICLLLASQLTSPGATFNFDLTETARDADLETSVDLATSFRRVDSAWVQIVGTFTPGLVTGVTVPPMSGPVITSDTVNLILRLGEVGTAWIDKQTYAIQDLQGMAGDIELLLPLRATIPVDVPVFMPSGDLDPDFSFLLDGKFGLSFSSMHWLTANLQSLESPRFDLTSFTLRVEGVAVPEPTYLAILAMMILIPTRIRVR